MGWLEGQVALVTGGGNGIGRAVAERFLEEGARVVVFDRDEVGAASFAALAGGAGAAHVGSVTSATDNEAAVALAVSRFGALDVLVGNAGTFDFFRPLSKYSPDQLSATFDEIFAVNVKGYLLAARAALASLRASRGSIVFTASNAALHAGGGGPLYVASKHAVVGVVRQLAYELAPDIRVNAVAPGGTITDLSGPVATNQGGRRLRDTPGLAEAIAGSMPLGFAMEPRDHTGAYVLLAAREQSRAITGAILPSDGGWEVRHPARRPGS